MTAEELAARIVAELRDGDLLGGYFDDRHGLHMVTLDGTVNMLAVATKILEWVNT